MNVPRKRAWCARAKWPDSDSHKYEPFLFGTAFAETEMEAEKELRALWAMVCPHEIIWLAFLPGMLVFMEEK